MVGIITTPCPCRTLDDWLVALKPWYIQSLIGSVFAPWRTVIYWLSQLANKSAIYLLYGCARTMCSDHVFDIVEVFGAVTMSITTVESVYTLMSTGWMKVRSGWMSTQQEDLDIIWCASQSGRHYSLWLSPWWIEFICLITMFTVLKTGIGILELLRNCEVACSNNR